MTPPVWMIIPAAGHGSRFGSETPKQYQPLLDKTVLEQTLSRFAGRKDIKGMVIAVSAADNWIETLALPDNVHIVPGGNERVDSVRAALQYLAGIAADSDLVAVHDAARPCVRQPLLDRLFAAAADSASGAIVALPVNDTVKQVDNDNITATLDRGRIFLAQTPQVFSLALLQKALSHVSREKLAVTDDASAVESLGLEPQVVAGDKCNIKITTAEDLPLAGFYLQRIMQEEQSCE